MNLLNDPWIPVRRSDGSRQWVTPVQLSDPEIIAFDADRPDFNGALAQFAIGLLQTTTPADNGDDWRELFHVPPSANTLQNWFSPVGDAFELDRNGARFMQDRSLRDDEGTASPIGSLLIESPGENTVKNNTDHFIKRGRIAAMCLPCAASSLLTLQINAPTGGSGHRTGLRGGGPLTTLILGEPPSTLWRDLWLNVRERPVFMAQGGDISKTSAHDTFPWLIDITGIQHHDGALAPIQVHPAHVFWAMPRRIRLDCAALSAGECDICRRETHRVVRQYTTRNYGLNYKGAWDHPLSPYYEAKDTWLPVHPQPDGMGYRHWLAWLYGLRSDGKSLRPARVVEHLLEHRRRELPGQLRLWAFGYDMDNMKARCWYEATLPLYGLTNCGSDARRVVESEVAFWLTGADVAAFLLRNAVKEAWFDSESRLDFGAINAAFWSRTQPQFYRQLKSLIEGSRHDADLDTAAVREAWYRTLLDTALDLFDNEFVGAGAIERQNPRRTALAFQQLGRNLRSPKIRQAVGLRSQSPRESKSKRNATKSMERGK